MAIPTLKVRWGPQFSNTLVLNSGPGTTYYCKSFDLFGGPQNDIILADTWLDNPYDVRQKLKQRTFSLNISIQSQTWSAPWVTRLDSLKQRLRNGPFRITMPRAGRGYQYITCRLQDISEDGTGGFIVKCLAADPTFSVCDVNGDPSPVVTFDDTGLPPYTVINLPLYVGSAPAEPVIDLEVVAGGYVYQYWQEVTITNPTDFAFTYYPVCLDLGNLTTWVGTYVNEIGSGDHRLRDLRLESEGGARKVIFVRDSGETGGTWHQDVRIWTVIYSLAPGETKTLRLLYGNPTADPNEIYNEPSSTKPMFNMYSSDNTFWLYTDFMPPWTAPQTRTEQWRPYLPGASNITWLSYVHPAFEPPVTGSGNVPCAGRRVMALGPTSGAVGLQLTVPTSISQVQWTTKFSGNAKTPLVLRSQRPDQRWHDDWSYGPDVAVLTSLNGNHTTGATTLFLDSLSRGGSTIAVGDDVMVTLDDGSIHLAGVTAVNGVSIYITIDSALPSAASDGNSVQQYRSLSWTTFNYPTGDQPKTLTFILRGDHPESTSGDWYFGGADQVKVYFATADQIQVTINPTRHDLNTLQEYQLRGQFGNSATNEYMRVNTHLAWGDKLTIDCAARTCMYYHWNGTTFDAPVSRFERLIFEAVRPSWIHIDPALTSNNLTFNDDADSNFRNLHVIVTYPVRYY